MSELLLLEIRLSNKVVINWGHITCGVNHTNGIFTLPCAWTVQFLAGSVTEQNTESYPQGQCNPRIASSSKTQILISSGITNGFLCSVIAIGY